MRKAIFSAALALAAALASAGAIPARAEEPAPVCTGADLTGTPGLAEALKRRAYDLVNGQGLFWKVEKPGLAPSYLFGTIHSTDDGALAIARKAAEKIKGLKAVATELGGPFDAMDKAGLAAAMFAKAIDRDHDTFVDLPENQRPVVEAFVTSRGLTAELAHHMQLWFLSVVTSLPQCEGQREMLKLPEVDEFLAETAKSAGVKVIGLESMSEQIDAIAAMRPQLAATLLTMAAKKPSSVDDEYVTMLRLYSEGRPAHILAIGDLLGDDDAERDAQNQFMDLLLIGRNETMATRAAPLLSAGGALIAVGALHLPGKAGLVERFRAAGYTVSKIW